MQLFYAKNGFKKQLIFGKIDHFENWQKWPPSKGYSLSHFGSQIKNAKEHAKNGSTRHYSCSMQKTVRKNR